MDYLLYSKIYTSILWMLTLRKYGDKIKQMFGTKVRRGGAEQ